jgi:hypothetical protein
MRNLVVVHAHQGTEQRIKRHEEYWHRDVRGSNQSGTILVVSPTDSPVTYHGSRLCFGEQGHHGPSSIARFKSVWRMLTALTGDFKQIIIHEYDSFIARRTTPDGVTDYLLGSDFRANEFISNTPGFDSHVFYHAPWIMTPHALKRICDALDYIPNDAEGGNFDRVLGLAIANSGINVEPFHEEGFSKNTIEPAHYEELRAAIKGGAFAFHGVKSAECFNIIKEVYP